MSKPHVHAEMIKQWADDPERVVEHSVPTRDYWWEFNTRTEAEYALNSLQRKLGGTM